MRNVKRKLIFFISAIFAGIIGILLLTNSSPVNADSGQDNEPLDCLSCHQQDLSYHDSLGSGNDACWTCHDTTDMKQLHLADGTLLPRSEPNVLCGQCHEEKYNAWKEGTHGFPGSNSAKCISCHDPHEPQIVLGFTLPHPAPAPDGPGLPIDLVMIVSISVVFLAGLLIVMVRRGQEE